MKNVHYVSVTITYPTSAAAVANKFPAAKLQAQAGLIYPVLVCPPLVCLASWPPVTYSESSVRSRQLIVTAFFDVHVDHCRDLQAEGKCIVYVSPGDVTQEQTSHLTPAVHVDLLY